MKRKRKKSLNKAQKQWDKALIKVQDKQNENTKCQSEG